MNAPISSKPQQKPRKNDNPVEQLRGMGSAVVSDVAHLATDVAGDALSSLLGTPRSPRAGSMQPGQAVSFDAAHQRPMPTADSRPNKFPGMPEFPPQPWGRREIRPPGISQETINRLRAKEHEVMQKIEEVRQELKMLIATLKSVDQSLVTAVNEQMVDPGEYHLAFLERIKTILKLIRQNLQSSNSWLNVTKSRKKQMGYWGQVKKKGTEWSLNNERNVATQVG